MNSLPDYGLQLAVNLFLHNLIDFPNKNDYNEVVHLKKLFWATFMNS